MERVAQTDLPPAMRPTQELTFDSPFRKHLEESLRQPPATDEEEADLAEIASLLLEAGEAHEEEPEASARDTQETINLADDEMEDVSFEQADADDLEAVEQEASASTTPDITQPMDHGQNGEEEADELTTQTLAELYVQQGLVEKAIKVYQKLLLNDSNNAHIMARLQQLNPMEGLTPPPAVEKGSQRLQADGWQAHSIDNIHSKNLEQIAEDRKRKISTLENWLTAIRRERS